MHGFFESLQAEAVGCQLEVRIYNDVNLVDRPRMVGDRYDPSEEIKAAGFFKFHQRLRQELLAHCHDFTRERRSLDKHLNKHAFFISGTRWSGPKQVRPPRRIRGGSSSSSRPGNGSPRDQAEPAVVRGAFGHAGAVSEGGREGKDV